MTHTLLKAPPTAPSSHQTHRLHTPLEVLQAEVQALFALMQGAAHPPVETAMTDAEIEQQFDNVPL